MADAEAKSEATGVWWCNMYENGSGNRMAAATHDSTYGSRTDEQLPNPLEQLRCIEGADPLVCSKRQVYRCHASTSLWVSETFDMPRVILGEDRLFTR